MKKTDNKLFVMMIILAFLFIFSYFSALFVEYNISGEKSGNVALINIDGVMITETKDTLLGENMISSDKILSFIKDADDDKNIEAIMIKINSPGGSPVASKEITDAIKRTNKTTVAVIREIGASGAYWVASAADHVIASEMAITGSVGVISSYMEYSGLLENYNITYRRLVAGEYKDIGSPFKEMSKGEEIILQKQLDRIQEYFITDVAENRNLSKEAIDEVSSAKIYLGWDAKDLGLVDELGDMEIAKQYLKKKLNTTEIAFVEYEDEPSFFDVLSSTAAKQSYNLGKGIGSAIIGNDNGVMT